MKIRKKYSKNKKYSKRLWAFRFYYYTGIIMLFLSVIGFALAYRSGDKVLMLLMFSLTAIFYIGTVSGKKRFLRNCR